MIEADVVATVGDDAFSSPRAYIHLSKICANMLFWQYVIHAEKIYGTH
ncbi:MAG: hypothetical protein GF363_07360 [Chitinivibrionales bacterium]|nr:hypothetical protein [Chitinivibrionales bacterium]